MEAIVIRLEAIATRFRLEAIATRFRLEAIAPRLNKLEERIVFGVGDHRKIGLSYAQAFG